MDSTVWYRKEGWIPPQKAILGYFHTLPDTLALAGQIELLFTHKKADICAISATERGCAAPISKVESHISDRSNNFLCRHEKLTGIA